MKTDRIRTDITDITFVFIFPSGGMKTDRIRTDITDITFVFIFPSGFGFEYE
jgi:hypothetical protein